MSGAKERILKGAEIHKVGLSRLLDEAESAVDRLHIIIAMQQLVFDHYMQRIGEAEAIDSITAMYQGHAKRSRPIQ